jgi:alkanesulfonate monooxygenase SsuD/methylene tetrahydromethanopterin reductase-like flavin-dependent oxidoreductase (luciferase family)
MTRALKVGLILPMFSGDPEKVLTAARAAEDLGFDGVFAFDHFFPPGAPPDRPALEAFTTLAGVAAATRRVRIGTLVTRAVLRPAGLLAKMAATLDTISGGRMVLGIGTGDPIDRPEHRAFGFPEHAVADRRDHLAETVAGVRALFRGDVYQGGRFVPALEGPLVPPPLQRGGPPVWIGAQADAVVRIAGALADGWNGWGMEADVFRRKVEILAESAASAGREVEATWAGIVMVGQTAEEIEGFTARRRELGLEDGLAFQGSPDALSGRLLALADAGATWAVLVLAGPAGRRELVAERVLPALER